MNRAEKKNMIKEEWKSPYFVMLGINAHLRECAVDFDRYMSSNTDALSTKHGEQAGKSLLARELNKELMDLLILLEMKRDNDCWDIYDDRINRFIEKYDEEQRLTNG
ncbi:hypothetical protein MHBO_004323 [Bonamia ostreae]|uniref:Uncharacterized protein n=1 Tax=Bonamia ostreae TaxID=126728 RepID=A0ABV2AT01_9EUKA